MKKEKAKKISKYITLLFMYFGSKMIFEELFEFNEFDKLAFKGYAYKGREKFINELPKEQIIQIQNFVQKIMNKKV